MAELSQTMRPFASAAQGQVAVLGVLAAAVVGIGVALGGAGVVLAMIFLSCVYYFMGTRWERGVYGVLLYLPFSGIVTLALHPWKAPLLFKDVLFVLPAYLGFFVCLLLGRVSLRGLPLLPVGLMLALTFLAVVQIANPGVANLLMGLIGLKVWVFYLPLSLLAFALVTSEQDVFRLFRLLACLALIPASVGLAQVVLSLLFGHRPTMEAIYGSLAEPVTQNFVSFPIGGGWLPRIPSTFSFMTQYFGYIFAMLVPCFVVWRGDPSFWWRHAGRWIFMLVAFAGMLCGARTSFVFIPLLLILMFGFERGFAGFMRSGTYAGGLLVGAGVALGIGVSPMLQHVTQLFYIYAEQTAYGGLVQAITLAPLGIGTGTNTGSARYAVADPGAFFAIENYYAKACYELGLPGLCIVAGLFLSLAFVGYRIHRRLQRPSLRSCSAGLLAFVVAMICMGFKGWLIDLDPVNVYFWLFAGILLKLPLLDAR